MWSTVIYIVLLLIGIVCYAYHIYVETRNNKLREEGKEIREKTYLIAVYIPLVVLPVTILTEKWLSPYIINEAAMYFCQTLVFIVLLLAIGIPVRRIAKRITVVFFAIVILGGCSLMYGYKPIKQFDKNEYEAVVASVMDDNFKMNSIISDSAQFASYRMMLSDSLWQYKTSAQPVQILYFKGDKLVSYHINCTAQGGLTGLNWNTDHRFETFPPASAMPKGGFGKIKPKKSYLCTLKIPNLNTRQL